MNPEPTALITMMRAFNPKVGVSASIGAMCLHLLAAWYWKSGAPISAGGALVIMFGVLTIARALIRRGDEKIMRSGRLIARAVREVDGKLVSAHPEEDRQQYEDARAEFQYGPAIVIVGTLINGYGSIFGDCFLGTACIFAG